MIVAIIALSIALYVERRYKNIYKKQWLETHDTVLSLDKRCGDLQAECDQLKREKHGRL